MYSNNRERKGTKRSKTLVLVFALCFVSFVYVRLLRSTYLNYKCRKLSSQHNLVIPNPSFFQSSCVILQFDDESKEGRAPRKYIRTGFISDERYIVKIEREAEMYGPNNTFGDNRNIENLIYFHLFDASYNNHEIIETYKDTRVAIAKPVYNFQTNKMHYLVFDYDGEDDDDNNAFYYHRSEEKFCHFMIRCVSLSIAQSTSIIKLFFFFIKRQ